MNQAQSRRLRTRFLLLLPLLVASTPAVSMATTSLELTGLPAPLPAGIPLTLTVTARNASGVDTEYAGTIHFSSTAPIARLPADYTFNPAVDHGTKTFLILFESLGQWEVLVQDINAPAIIGQVPSVTVQAGPPASFTVILDSPVVVGRPYTFAVIPVDGAGNQTGYNGTLHFGTDDLSTKLPTDFTGSIDPALPPQFPITFAKASPSTKTITVTDLSSGRGITGSITVTVLPGVFDHVELSWLPPNPAPTCGEATIVITAEDDLNNPVSDVPSSTQVILCAQPGHSASFVRSTPSPSAQSGNCVTVPLANTAQVIWKDQVEEDVDFTVDGVPATASLTVHWKGGIPSPLTSSFAFRESTPSTSPTALVVYGGQLTAELTLRDQCGNPAMLPQGKVVSFAADPALVLTSPVEDRPGRWTASVSMPACPADPSEPLPVWPLIDNEVMRKPNGEQVQRLVQPQCSVVQLSLLSPADSLVAEPGALVEFELQVSNDSDATISGSVLMLEAAGLTVAGVGIDGQSLPPKGAGFELPELRQGSPLKVKVTAQATTQPNPQMTAKVWVTTPAGAKLAEKQSVEFHSKDLGVDVGCGSSSTGLPSQFVTWLVLLLVASRPWEGLRRLRRGERNGH